MICLFPDNVVVNGKLVYFSGGERAILNRLFARKSRCIPTRTVDKRNCSVLVHRINKKLAAASSKSRIKAPRGAWGDNLYRLLPLKESARAKSA